MPGIPAQQAAVCSSPHHFLWPVVPSQVVAAKLVQHTHSQSETLLRQPTAAESPKQHTVWCLWASHSLLAAAAWLQRQPATTNKQTHGHRTLTGNKQPPPSERRAHKRWEEGGNTTPARCHEQQWGCVSGSWIRSDTEAKSTGVMHIHTKDNTNKSTQAAASLAASRDVDTTQPQQIESATTMLLLQMLQQTNHYHNQ